jgi:hypothetical protein
VPHKKTALESAVFLARQNYFLAGSAGIAAASDFFASVCEVCFLVVLALCGAAAGFSAAGAAASAAMADRLNAPTIDAAMREDISLFKCFSSVFKLGGYAINGMQLHGLHYAMRCLHEPY